MTQHAIVVVPSVKLGPLTFNYSTLLYEQESTPAGFEWRCHCGAAGNSHDDHQTALEFGLAHLAHLAIEREGGQA